MIFGLTEPNARKVLAAVREFYKGVDIAYSAEKLMDPENILRLGVRPSCIEIFTDLVGKLRFRQAWRNRVNGKFGSVEAKYVGLEDLILLKTDSGRPQDLVDVGELNRALKETKKKRSRK